MEHDIGHGPQSSAGADQSGGAEQPDVADRPPDLPPTGEPRVDAALRQLGELGDLPASEHPPVFERIHGQLVEVLGELRADPGSAGGARLASD